MNDQAADFHDSANFKALPIQLPPVADVYEHHKGNLYLVVGYNNLESHHPDHPPMVEYVGVNGNKWSKPLSTWYAKMKPTNREFVFDADCAPYPCRYTHKSIMTLTYVDQEVRTHA